MPPRRENGKSLRYKFEGGRRFNLTQIKHCFYLG